jgi:hypothetical protein
MPNLPSIGARIRYSSGDFHRRAEGDRVGGADRGRARADGPHADPWRRASGGMMRTKKEGARSGQTAPSSRSLKETMPALSVASMSIRTRPLASIHGDPCGRPSMGRNSRPSWGYPEGNLQVAPGRPPASGRVSAGRIPAANPDVLSTSASEDSSRRKCPR